MDRGDLAFQVRYDDGRVFSVYASGRIEGFPEGDPYILNRIPLLQSMARRSEDAVLGVITPEASPTLGLLVSIAVRLNHSFGLLDAKAQTALLNDARHAWEEIHGLGFYSPDKEASYCAMLKPTKVA